MSQCSTLRSTVAQNSSWHTGWNWVNRQDWVADWRRWGVGGGRAAEGHQQWETGWAAMSLMHDIDGTHIPTFENWKLKGSYVGDVLQKQTPDYPIFWSELFYLLMSLCVEFSKEYWAPRFKWRFHGVMPPQTNLPWNMFLQRRADV